MRPPAGKHALLAVLLCVGGLLLLGMEIPTTSEPALSTPGRSLTFAERVAYQQAIEEVYWRHRIWPKDNPAAKPPLDDVIPRAQLERKVADVLRKSQFVTDQRACRISPSELQAEMDRMAQHTKRPKMLRELFAALGNDPFVIAECLARPAIAEHLIVHFSAVAQLSVSSMNLCVVGTVARTKNRTSLMANFDNADYKLPEITVPADCLDDTWTATSLINAPDGRIFHTAVWTGSELIVWGGVNSIRLNSGAKYDPTTDSWIPTQTNNAASPRDYHSAVWTGSEMIVWGGEPILNTGARYNPITDNWTAISTTNAPAARAAHTAVWTGSEMIVWGGRNGVGRFNTGGRYNPSTDSWTATSTINAPEARWYHSGVWTGGEMVIWGGTNQSIYLDTGGRYDPTDNSWTATTTANAPLGRVGHSTIWSGSQMIVWGGTDSTFNDTNTGSRYNAITNSWTAITTVNAPSARDSHAAVWTDTEMIVWGGIFCCPTMDFDTGGLYDAATDSWTATNTADAALPRSYHTAVWTDTEMIIWGGFNSETQTFLNTGGRYCAESVVTPTPTPSTTPSATGTPTATPASTPRMAPTPRNRPTPAPHP